MLSAQNEQDIPPTLNRSCAVSIREVVTTDPETAQALEVEAVARGTKPCEYCETQYYKEFVLRELLDRALIELGETGALEEAFAGED